MAAFAAGSTSSRRSRWERGPSSWADPRSGGLAADGPEGARRVIEVLREELELAMILAGMPDLESIGPELLLDG
jgi:FMN-dependent dehydrogenase